jgi:hypothetical protein
MEKSETHMSYKVGDICKNIETVFYYLTLFTKFENFIKKDASVAFFKGASGEN